MKLQTPRPRVSLRTYLPWLALCLAAPLSPAQDQTKREQAHQETQEVGRDMRAESAPVYPPEDGLLVGMSLEQVIESALVNNLGLEIERLATEIARFDARGSWGAFDWVFNGTFNYQDGEFEPTQNVDGGAAVDFENISESVDFSRPLETGGDFGFSYNRRREESSSPNASAAAFFTDDLSLTLTQPLLRGAWYDYATSSQHIAEYDYEGQRERQRGIRQNLVRDVSDAYWDLVSAIEQLAVVQGSLELGLEQLAQNERRVEAGVGTDIEVVQAQADVARRLEVRLQAWVTVLDAEDVLKSLLLQNDEDPLWGMTLTPTTGLPETADDSNVMTWREGLEVAIDERADLRQQRVVVATAELQYLRSRSERRIGVDLDLSAQSRGFDPDSEPPFHEATGFDFPTYTAGLRVNVPLGNRTRKYAEKAARSALRSARLVYDQMEVQVVAEVREAVRQVRYQAEAVRASVRSADLAQQQLDAEQLRYDEGLSTNFQVLEFQQELVVAQSSERAARANFAKARVGLRSVLGILDGK